MGIHDGHRQRLKQHFLTNGQNFHDYQLLELLLCYAIPKKDVNPLAHQLLIQYGSLAGVLDALPDSLCQMNGISQHSAVLLKLIPHIANRYHHDRTSMGTIINNSKTAQTYLTPLFPQGTRNEMVYVLCMDGKRKVLGCHKVSEGTATTAEIIPRKVVEVALSLNATNAILAHNHVSGLALPSHSDCLTTQKLWTILQDVGVTLVDHMIFANGDMVSMKDSGAFNWHTNHT